MVEHRIRVAEAIAAARQDAGVSQRALAERLGRDKRTIQKWEKGEMKITLEDFLDIFDALKIPVEAYSKWIRNPELFPRGLDDIRGFSTDKKRSALADYYEHQASPLEVEQEYYFLFANHGSSCDGMYQQWMANLMTPLRDRKRICGQIIGNYYEARELGAPGQGHRRHHRPGRPAAQHGCAAGLLRGQLPERAKRRQRLRAVRPESSGIKTAPSAYNLRRGLLYV